MGQVYFWYQTRDLGTDTTLCVVALLLTTPITVLDVRDSPWVDGPGRTILETAESIDSRRIRIIVAGFSTAQGDSDAYLGEARKRGLLVQPIIERKAFDRRIIEQVLRVIDEHKVDVLHTHDFRSDVVGLFCAVARKVPIVTTCHGWIGNNLKGRIYTWIDKSILRYFDHIVTVSGVIKRQLLSAGLPDGKVEVIPNALKISDFMVDKEDQSFRNELNIPNHWKVLANIGRLSKEKGQALLLQAFADAYPIQKNICLVFVGIGPEEHRLKELAMNLNIADHVFFAGFQKNMNAVYNSVNLVVQSSFTEGMPNVVLESLLMETPVIATDVGGTAEIIIHKENGYLMDPDSHGDILSGILNFLDSESDFIRMARRGRTHVTSNFDSEIRVKRLESMYQRVVAMSNKGKSD
jgi:glycosyltransferase involved in cell wall biosynthesis